jgi:hypothetical protein
MPIRNIKQRSLKLGDVVLYRGTSLISRLIIWFDGGHYSHCSIYVGGGKVLEAIDKGVVFSTLADSIAAHAPEYVDVFRFTSDDHIMLGDSELPYQPVKSRVDFYGHEGERYAYEDILLLALLTTIRHISIARPMLRSILDSAAEVLAHIAALGKRPLICSGLTYRCFEEAGRSYHIHVPDADLLATAERLDSRLVPAPVLNGPLVVRGAADARLKLAFLRKLGFASDDLSSKFTHVHDEAWAGVAQIEPAPDFVTPGDLEHSPNLELVGRLL